MRKPNVIFLSIIAMAALLPHTTRWMSTPDITTTAGVPRTVTDTKPVSDIAAAPAVPDTRVPAEHPTNEMHISPADPVVEPVKASGPLAALEETYLTEGDPKHVHH
jgi:hypothetical protein